MNSPVITFRSGEAKICSALRYEEGNESVEFSIYPRSNVLALPKDNDWRTHFPSVVRGKKTEIVALIRRFCGNARWIVVKENVEFEQTLPVIYVQRGAGGSTYYGNLARIPDLDVEQRQAELEARRPII